MKQNLRYKRKRVTVNVDYPIRKGICECCRRKGKTQLHHWKYSYTSKQIKNNPILALENTTELDFYCHRLANMIVHITKEKQRIEKLMLIKSQLEGEKGRSI